MTLTSIKMKARLMQHDAHAFVATD